jgi:cell division protein FtsQ
LLLAVAAGLLFGIYQHSPENFKLFSELKSFGQRAFKVVSFPIEQIQIVGHHNTQEKEIIKSLGNIWDSSVIGLNTLAAQKNIEKLPWIKRAVVERVFPHGINIFVEERVPVGRWSRLDGMYLFDNQGVIIAKLSVGGHRNLPIYSGDDAPVKASELQTMLTNFKDIRLFVARFQRVDKRRWTLVMKSGMEVLLPEVQTEMALARLRRLHNTHDLLNRRLDVVDLRLEDRVTLRPKKAGSVKLLSSTEGDKADRDNVARLIEGMITDDDAGAANDETGREKFGRGETGRDRINNGINDAL